jgi:type IX secretion system PorP/SprF family membrane protein
MKNIFTLAIIVTFSSVALAQQPVQYSLYMWNKFAFNPAYAGLDNSLSLTGVYRKQWTGLSGSPTNQSLNAHMPLYVASGGMGISLENETIGSWKRASVMLAYNYQKPFGNGILSLGLSGGLVQRELDGSKIRTPQGVYVEDNNLIDHQDLILPLGKERGLAPTFGGGVYYQGEKLEVGISAINLLENEIALTNLAFKTNRTYYFLLSYQLDFGKNLTLHPSIHLKSNVTQSQLDFSLLGKYNENIFAGASFRGYNSNSIDAVVLFGGFKLSEKISLLYAYDMTLSELNTVSTGSHEILLNYNLGKIIGKGKPPKIIYNPRSL